MGETTKLAKECVLLAMEDVRELLKLAAKDPTAYSHLIPICGEALRDLSEAYKNISMEA